MFIFYTCRFYMFNNKEREKAILEVYMKIYLWVINMIIYKTTSTKIKTNDRVIKNI